MSTTNLVIEQLHHLRYRLSYCLGIILVAFIITFSFSHTLFNYLAQPLLRHLIANQTLIATNIITPILTPLKLSLYTSLIIAMPCLLWQTWAFVAPALYQHEKQWIQLIMLSCVLFYLGIAFAYFVLLPILFAFVTSLVPAGVSFMPDMASYLDFTLQLLLVCGLLFQIPLVMLLLSQMQIVSLEQWLSYRRVMIVIAFILGMLLTPPDVISQIMLAIPICLLYECGIMMCWWLKRKNNDESA